MDIKTLLKQIIQMIAGASLLLFISMVIVVACSSCEKKRVEEQEYSDIQQIGELYLRGIYTADYKNNNVVYKVFIFDDNIFVINTTKDSLETELIKKKLDEGGAAF